jgi:hypothetical protein
VQGPSTVGVPGAPGLIVKGASTEARSEAVNRRGGERTHTGMWSASCSYVVEGTVKPEPTLDMQLERMRQRN